MLSILQTWVRSVAADHTRGRTVWSATDLIAAGDTDAEQVGKGSHDAADVLQGKGQ